MQHKVIAMIDTIVLLLNREAFHINNPNKFTPHAQWVSNSSFTTHGMQSKQNPTKKELARGIYKPRLTLFQGINTLGLPALQLKIEASLPKLFFGNNFNELRFKDIKPAIEKLSAILKDMGVIVIPETLLKAPVSTIHYSKNIPLIDGSTPYHYIQKIKEAQAHRSLDVNQTDYSDIVKTKADMRNDGLCYKWHCNSYEVVFYDKIKDVEKAKISHKRAVEKDSTIQSALLKRLKKQTKKFEVLRMEVRLNKRQKMKRLFSKLGIKTDLTLTKLCKPAIAKKVLLHYLDELESKRPPLLDFKQPSDKALLAALIVNNPELSPKKIVYVFGLKKALESMNSGELRNIFIQHTIKKSAWYKLIADMHKIALPRTPYAFGKIRNEIIQFKPIKLL